jgi:hypothetical protein
MRGDREMSDTTSVGISRRQLLEAAGTTAAALTTLGVGGAAAATAPNPVPLQISVKGPIPDIVAVPLEPTLLSGRPSLSGQSALLGQVAYIDDHEGRVGIDGNPVFANGRGVLTGANGDALFVTWVQLFGPPTATGAVEGTGAFVVTGGKGNYCGAGGSGSLRILFDPAAKQVTFTYEGMVATPKK